MCRGERGEGMGGVCWGGRYVGDGRGSIIHG